MNLHPYPTMKSSGVEWLGEVPEHWKVARLKTHLSRNESGVWSDNFDDEGTMVLRSTEQTVTGGWIITSPARINLPTSKIASALLKSGDLVVTKSSGSKIHIGKTSLVDDEIEQMHCCFSNFMQRLRLDKFAVPAFVWCNLNSPVGREQLVFQSTATTGLGNLNGTILGNCRFAFPPLPEQTAIVRYLDYMERRVRRFVRAKEKLIDLLAEQKQAIVHRAVTRGLDHDVSLKPSGVEWLGEVPKHWEVRRLKNLCSRSALYGANLSASYYTKEGVRFLRTTDITAAGLLKKGGVFLPNGLVADHLLNDGDVLISRSGTVGRSFLYQSHLHGLCSYAGYLVRFVLTLRILPKYVFLFTKTRAFEGFLKVMAISSTIENVNAEKYANTYLPLPPLPEQTAIVEHIDKATANIDAAITRARREIKLLREYRTRLISDVVTGKLDVRKVAAQLPDEPDEPELPNENDAPINSEEDAVAELEH